MSSVGSAAEVIGQEFVAEYPIDELVYLPGNPNQGDIGAIMGSIAANRFYGAVIVQRGTGVIVAGNHRVEAARQLGLTHVPALVIDADDEQVHRIALADNRLPALSSTDQARLAEWLTALASTDLGLEGTGYDGDDLDELLADLQQLEEPPPLAEEGPTVWRVIVEVDDPEQADALVAQLNEAGFNVRKEAKR